MGTESTQSGMRYNICRVQTLKYAEDLSVLPRTKIIHKLEEPFLNCRYLLYVTMYQLYLGSWKRMPEVIVLLPVHTIAQASYCWGSVSIPEYSTSILWLAEWQWSILFSKNTSCSLPVIIPPFLYLYTIWGWHSRLWHDRFSSNLCANSEIYEPDFCFFCGFMLYWLT
jgi:hypothetical protein